MRNLLLRVVFHLVRLLRPRSQAGPPVYLVLQYRLPLGCCVHGTPLYTALKAARPDAILIVATRDMGLTVLQHDPHIDHLLATDDPGNTVRSVYQAAQRLREDLLAQNLYPTHVLQDATNRRGTLTLFALLLLLAPVTSFADLHPLCDKPLQYDASLSLIDNNLRLVGPSTPHIEPAVYFTLQELDAARSLLVEANPESRPLTAVVVQGSGGQPNSWHHDRFAAALQYVESCGHRTVFLGTEAEAAAIDRIRALVGSSGISLAGRTSVPELAALLCLCDMLITVDTGAMHVGRAAGLPMVVLAPAWQPAVEWLPLTLPNVRVLRGPDRADKPKDYKLDEIEVDSVTAAFTDLDSHFPPSPTARAHRVERLLSTTLP